MDYLFAELCSGAGSRATAGSTSAWRRSPASSTTASRRSGIALGALLFRYGEHFYNFQGLREFKEKFDPVWEPRFLAAPGGLAVPFVLTHVAALISGGVTGVVAR